jgi:NADP-dependent 3-hydroxy acid dehydrogenase YdfG
MTRGVVAITAGASGLGLAIAPAAASVGYRVEAAGRNCVALEAARAALPNDALFSQLDVTHKARVEGWIAEASDTATPVGLVTAADVHVRASAGASASASRSPSLALRTGAASPPATTAA